MSSVTPSSAPFRSSSSSGAVSVSTYQGNDGQTRASLEVNADDEIAKVSVANATEEEFKDLTDKLVSAFATAESFSDKLYTGEELTEEEENKLNEAISTLESNPIVGRAVKKIADEADKKYGGE